MANIYVSNAGSNTSPYDTWAKAATTLATAAGAEAAGDNIYISSTHAEADYGANTTLAFAGSLASPNSIVVGTTAATPPTTIGSGVEISTGSTYTLSLTGSFYCYGIDFKVGVGGTGNLNLTIGQTLGRQVYENCNFYISTSGSASRIKIGTSSIYGSSVEMINCGFSFANASQHLWGFSLPLKIKGGSIISGSSAITSFIEPLDDQSGFHILVENFDFSNAATGLVLITSGNLGTSPSTAIFRNCKLPASWNGSLVSAISYPNHRFAMHNCAAGDTNYALWEQDYFGTVRDETTIVMSTGGASDGTTTLSWKMVSTANAEYPSMVFYSPEIVRWNETLTSVTVTVEFLIDSATTLNNNDVWMEVNYNGTSGNPLGVLDTDSEVANVLTTAAECTAGAGLGSWSGESGTAKSYKLTSTFTPAEKGWFIARVALAKASTTIYVNPVLTIS